MRYRPAGLSCLPALTLWAAAGFFVAPGPLAGDRAASDPVARAGSSFEAVDGAQASPWATRSGPGVGGPVPDGGDGVSLRVPPLASRHQPALHRQGVRASNARIRSSHAFDALVRAGLHVWGTAAPPPFRFA